MLVVGVDPGMGGPAEPVVDLLQHGLVLVVESGDLLGQQLIFGFDVGGFEDGVLGLIPEPVKPLLL